MGFGPSFRSWVSLLYSSVNSAVIVNGHLTEFFPVTRGVRQGCPLSPLLYVLVAETMACKVREDDHIDGFPLPCSNRRIKVSQYADDTTVLVCSDFSLMALFQLFASYERASGARINLSKCSGLLGPWRSRDPVSMPIQIKWSTDSIRVLGSLIHPGGEQNWGPLLGKLTTLVDAWKPRHLSFRGRALIMNTLGLSKFWYLGSICSIPFNIIRRINHIIFPFLWNKKREWISRSSLTQPTNQGGLGIVDLHRKLSSLTVLWVKRFLLGADHSWKFFFRYFLRRTMLAEPVERVFTQSNISTATLRTLRSFYQRVIQSWLDIKGNTINSLWVVPRPEPSPNIPLDHLTACIAYRPLTQLQHSPPRCETIISFYRMVHRLGKLKSPPIHASCPGHILASLPWCLTNRRSPAFLWHVCFTNVSLWSTGNVNTYTFLLPDCARFNFMVLQCSKTTLPQHPSSNRMGNALWISAYHCHSTWSHSTPWHSTSSNLVCSQQTSL